MFQWFVLPTSIFYVCGWQYSILRAEATKNTTALNITTSDNSAADLALYFGFAFELVYIFFTPLALGQMFSGQEKIRKSECFVQFPKYMKTLLLATVALLLSYLVKISFEGHHNKYTVLLSLLPRCLHWSRYWFIRFSAFLLIGSVLEGLTKKNLSSKEETIVVDTRRCLKDHHQLTFSAGPFLLFTMSVDSLLVMLYSFMVYMAWTYSFYYFMLHFLFMDINVIFSLVYICISCEHYCNALKSLLIPLRYSNKLQMIVFLKSVLNIRSTSNKLFFCTFAGLRN